MSQSTTGPRFPRDNRRRVIGGAVGAVVLVGASLIGWRVWANRAPALDASRQDLAKFVASEKFDALPKDEQKQYADAMMKQPLVIEKGGSLPEPELAAMRRTADQHRQEMLDGYFKLTDAKAKKAYLDKIIDQQEQARKFIEEGQKNASSGKPGDGKMRVTMKAGGAAGQKQMAETTPPAVQAQMAQFMKDVNDRRAERGLNPVQGFMIVRTSTGTMPK